MEERGEGRQGYGTTERTSLDLFFRLVQGLGYTVSRILVISEAFGTNEKKTAKKQSSEKTILLRWMHR